MSKLFRLAPLALLMLALAPVSHAERADRDKPVVIHGDRGSADDVSKKTVVKGHATLTQGTLVVNSDDLTATQDAEGYQQAVATGGKDGLARFRQKKEGRDEYIEGEAERIEYDGRTDKVKLFVRALFRSGQNEARGQYIEYDGYTEQYAINNIPGAIPKKDGDGQFTVVIVPKSRTPDASQSKPAAKP